MWADAPDYLMFDNDSYQKLNLLILVILLL